MFRSRLPIALLIIAACAAPDSDSDTTAAVATSGVALARTAPGEMPPAIVGDGGVLQGVDLSYVDGDAATTGYLAVPQGDGPFPALVIIHEWNGLVDRVRQLADDFAAEGYVTLAADLYSGQVGSNSDENIALMNAATANTFFSRIDAKATSQAMAAKV